jgi:hypothetical protein
MDTVGQWLNFSDRKCEIVIISVFLEGNFDKNFAAQSQL